MAGKGIAFQIRLKGLKELQDAFGELRKTLRRRSELHRRLGIVTLNWIDDNFRHEGGMSGKPWAKLAPSTIAAKGSSAILQDKGKLRQSFTSNPGPDSVAVGSALFYAEFHELGGTSYYEIHPVRAKALAFVAGPNFARFAGTTKFGGAKKTRVSRVRASFSSVATRNTYKKGTDLVLAAFVNHPPLIQRKMLPEETNQDFMARLIKTANGFLRPPGGPVVKGSGGGAI